MSLLFADDTTLYMSDSNLDRLVQNVNLEFKKVVDYFRFQKLALHPEKTKFILFSNSNEVRNKIITIQLNFNNDADVPNTNLISNLVRITSESETPAIKFLGIYIDPLLSFKFHINSIVSKVSKSLYFFRGVKHFLPAAALKSIYYAIVHSHFIYGIQIWSCTSKNNLNTLFLKQKIAIRIINSVSYNAHTEPLFKKSGILPLETLVEFFNLKFFHNFIHNELPISFANLWMRNEDRRNEDRMNLRNNQDYFIPSSRLTSTEKFPLYNLPRLWCNFEDQNIKQTPTKNLFNIRLKIHFLDKLKNNYICQRLLCPHCHLNT